MILRPTWQVIPGYGQAIVENIRSDIGLWRSNRADVAGFEADNTKYQQDGKALILNVAEAALRDIQLPTLDASISMLAPRYRDEIALAAVASAVADRLTILEAGIEHGERYKKARVTISQPGVVVTTLFGGPGPSYKHTKVAEAGRVFEGSIVSISSAPKTCGRIVLDRGFRRITMSDIVAPSTQGLPVPRVQLEIFGRDS